jgi:tetratricopeptide (TPR) repeat protein
LADSLFNAGDYAKALPVFKELCDSYPRDYYYNYALGVCFMNSLRKVDLAIPYLSKASAGEVPNKVYFYLAEAFRKTYRFDQAIDYYRRFTINGGSKDIKATEIEKYLTLCENGNSLLKYIYSPQIVDKKRVGVSDFFQYYSLLPKSASLIGKPDNLKSDTDQKQNERTVILYPNNPQTGDYIYYSSYGKSIQYGMDIYRIKRLKDGYWSKPENLGAVINTSEDEDFPYIAPDGITLYFASKGHYSMGGYDIYRSVFDAGTKKWSNPENLGFPFCSPYDDILYIPDSKDSLACFATNRNCEGDSVEVVMYQVDKNPIQRSFTSFEEVQGIALLKINDRVINSIKVDDGTPNRESNPNAIVKPKVKSASFNAVENDPEYIRVITKGFSKQKETDSLRVKLEKLRERFDYITTAEERKSLESKVVKVENSLLAAQGEADKMFAQASQIEQEYLTGKRIPQGTANSNFTSDNPDYLYQAQFAPTVFRSDEIGKLTQVEKLQGQINSARDEVVSAKAKYNACFERNDSTSDCKALYNQMNAKMNAYSGLVSKWFDVKYRIYSDCVMVAIVKSGNNNSDEAKAEIDRANSHFRASSTIKNNLSDEGRAESLYEASLLNEIGVLRLELAFARTWGMNMFEQQSTSRVMRLEKIAFGNTLPLVVAKTNKEKPVDIEQEKKQEVGISRVETTANSSESILIKNDDPLAFQVVDKLPYDAQNPIPVNEPYPAGVIYKIQLGAFSKPLELSSFKGMIPVSIERVSGAKVSKYFMGRFVTFVEAEKALAVVRLKGFKDAFIVAWLDGKSIPVSRAQTMEGKQGNKNTGIPKSKAVTDTTSVKGRLYIVQIGEYPSKIPDSVFQTVKAMASGKDIFRKSNEQGQMTYSIGNYSTVEDANRIKDNLIASGISGAEVVAVEVEKK